MSVSSEMLSSPLRPRIKPFCLGSMIASSAGIMLSAMTEAVILLEVLFRVIGRVRSTVGEDTQAAVVELFGGGGTCAHFDQSGK